MPRWPPIPPDLIVAIRVLDADGMPYAELWRQMRGVARNLGIRCPTYWMVRRLAIVERERKAVRMLALRELKRDRYIRPLLPRILR